MNDSLFGSTGNGLDIKSRTYTNDGNYKDEWEIYDIYNYAHLSLNARIYYDSTVTYSASYISSMYHDATEIFSTIYSIRFNLEAITYANELNCSSACHSTALNDIHTILIDWSGMVYVNWLRENMTLLLDAAI